MKASDTCCTPSPSTSSRLSRHSFDAMFAGTRDVVLVVVVPGRGGGSAVRVLILRPLAFILLLFAFSWFFVRFSHSLTLSLSHSLTLSLLIGAQT